MMVGNRAVPASLIAMVVVVLIALGLSLSSPLWLLLLLILPILAIPLFLGANEQEDTHEPIPPAEFPRRELPVGATEPTKLIPRTRLDSAAPDYRFDFTAAVRWRNLDERLAAAHVDPAQWAINAILRRAYQITKEVQPGQYELAAHRLNELLGRWERDEHGCLEACATNVSLSLTEVDRVRLDRMASIRKDKELWQQERAYEQEKREYYGDDVLKSTGSAVVWALVRNEQRVEESVRLIGSLARLSAAANDRDIDPRYRHVMAESGAQAGADTLFPVPIGATANGNGFNGYLTRPEPNVGDRFEEFLRSVGHEHDGPARKHFVGRVLEALEWDEKRQDAASLRARFFSESIARPSTPPDDPDPEGDEPRSEEP